MVVAVDVYTKWVEVGLFKSLTSAAVTDWFHREINCRFGTPFAVRTDNGKEYMGVFDKYCRSMGIKRMKTSTYHPQSNGIVERYIGVLKAGMRRMKVAFPQGEWYQFIPELIAGLRVLPSKSGYSPFLLVYKAEANWPTVTLESLP